MELPVGTHLEMDGYSEDVEQDEDYSYYMDKDGAIYVGYFSDTVDDYDNYLVDYVYMGNGKAYDSMNREIDFKCTKLADIEAYIDWTHEREWRVPDELLFTYKNIEIIVPSDRYYRSLINRCIDAERLDILKEIHGIITLDSVYL